jgi:asparagine synthase (glutamine-hydrolysing)
VKQFLKGFESKKQYTHTLWLGSFTPNQKKSLMTKDALSQITNTHGLNNIGNYINEKPSNNSFNQLLYSYYRTYLLDDILVKVDRASMYNSLEVRAPFLDVNVVNFLNTLPQSYKIKGFNVKYLLKSLMRNKIPDKIIDRPKKGFGIPVSLWLKNDLKNLCEELLSEKRIRDQNIFNYDYILKLKQEHYSSKKNHRKLIWNLMIFALWSDKYLH